MITIQVLKAGSGDCFIIKDSEYKNNILIDGGVGATYSFYNHRKKREPGPLQRAIKKIVDADERIDPVILTHTDNDHIGGLLKWVESSRFVHEKHIIRKVWFNSHRTLAHRFGKKENDVCLVDIKPEDTAETSYGQGIKLENFLEAQDIPYKQIIDSGTEYTVGNLKLTVLSPSEETLYSFFKAWEMEYQEPDSRTAGPATDYDKTITQLLAQDTYSGDTSCPNGSSISFLLTCGNKHVLFLGDAYAEVVAATLRSSGYSEKKPLQAEYVKLSHHGSARNTSYDLLGLIDCSQYIISTNGQYALPDKLCLARIINRNRYKRDLAFYFNYPGLARSVFSVDKIDAGNFSVRETGEIVL